MMARGLSKCATRCHRGACPACQAEDGVEFPTGLVNLEGQFFNQVVVFIIRNVQMLAVLSQHGVPSKCSCLRLSGKQKRHFQQNQVWYGWCNRMV